MTFARLWLIVVISMAVLLSVLIDKNSFQTNLFALLPETTDDQLPIDTLDKYSEKLSRRIIYLVTSSSIDNTEALTTQLSSRLKESRLFDKIEYKFSKGKLQEIFNTYKSYQFVLLTDEAKKSLEASGGKWLTSKLVRSLVSPVSGAGSEILKQDPFGLMTDYIGSLPKGGSAANFRNGYVYFQYAGKEYFLVSAVLSGSAFDQGIQDRYQQLLDEIELIQDKKKNDTIYGYGILYHATANRIIAQKEITYIGIGSLLAIIMLFYLVFRRFTIMAYILLPILTGSVTALTASILVFGEIHLVTLVFGASLIGVSIDYTFHYCCSNSDLTDNGNGVTAVSSIRKSLTLGLLTSVIGYLTLATTDFPSLRQMALFSSTGLIGAYLTVTLWLPYLISRPLKINPTIARLVDRLAKTINHTRQVPTWSLGTLLVILIVLLISFSKAEDDINLMWTNLPELNAIDKLFKDITREAPNNQYFVVTGKDPNTTLNSERALVKRLKALNVGNSRVSAISNWFPSVEQQGKNYKIIYESVNNNPSLDKSVADLGLAPEVLENYKKGLLDTQGKYFAFNDFIRSPVARYSKDLWIGKRENQYYSIVGLFGFSDVQQLHEVAAMHEDVILIDRANTVTGLMKRYRTSIETLAPLILLAITALLTLRYGVTGALQVVFSPVAAALLSLMIVQFVQGHYNLFNVFGLIISIAVAIDYAVFLKESKQYPASTYLAISLSGLTTVISLGILTLSKTPALQSFGLTLLLGVVFSYIITTIVVRPGARA